MQKNDVPVVIDRVDRLASILMNQNLTYELFDVRFGTRTEAQEVLEAIGRLGLRVELHPFQDTVRIFRDTKARADSMAAGEVFEIELVRGTGGFLSN